MTPTRHYLLVATDFYPRIGGIARFVHGLANGLVAGGHRVTLVAPEGSQPPEGLEARYALLVDDSSQASVRSGRSARKEDKRIRDYLTAIHRDDRFDRMLVMHPFYYGPAAIELGRTEGVPTGAFAYGYEVRSQAVSDGNGEGGDSLPARTRFVYEHAGMTFPISQSTQAAVTALLGHERSTMVTGCGVAPEETEQHGAISPVYDAGERRQRRRNLGYSEATTVSFLGRLVPSKSVDTLLVALARCRDVSAWVIGDGPQAVYLRSMAADLGIADRVVFHGSVDEGRKWDLLHASDAIVLPSVELAGGAGEGFGIALLEGAAAGCVPIGSASGGITDVIQDERTGLLFRPSSPELLARVLERVRDEEQQAAAMVSAARDDLDGRFRWDRIATRVDDALDALAGPRRHGPAGTTRPKPDRTAGGGVTSQPRPRWLVVTDAFPPRARGGAEVSLKLVIDRLKVRGCHIDVAVLDPDVRVPTTAVEEANGAVYRIPFSDSWLPEPWNWGSSVGRRLATAHPRVTPVAMAGAYMARRHGSSRADRARRLWLYRELRSTGRQGLMPLDDDDMATGKAVDAIRSLMRTRVYAGLHADNYRSILVASEAAGELPWVALVRDNRFFCAHPGGDMRIGASACGHCLFECTQPVDDLPVRESLVGLMAKTIEARRARLARADAIGVTSEFLKDEIDSVLPLDVPVLRVRNPIEDPDFIDLLQQGVEPRRPLSVLVVGMIGHNKGQAQLPAMATEVAKVIPDFTFALCGRGHMIDGILADAEARGVRDRFIHLGFLTREAIYREYARSAVALVPAVWPEPFGRIPLEAGASRRPVISFATGGLPEVVRHGETGLLVEPGDVDGMTEALVELLGSPHRRAAMGEAGREFVLKEFNVDRAADEMHELWRSVAPGSAAL